jgi:hypothetical protein
MSETNGQISTPCVLLFYDIPTQPVMHPDGVIRRIRNPTYRLRTLGAHIQYSGWLLPASRVPYSLLNELAQLGVTWDLIEQDQSQAPKLTKMALRAFRKEADKAIRNAMKSEQNAQANAEERGPDAYREWVDRSIRRAETALQDMANGAAALGLTFNTQANVGALNGLRSAAHARAAIYASMVEEARRRGLATAAQLADSAQLPGQVLADMLEEEGADMETAHEAFDGVSMG